MSRSDRVVLVAGATGRQGGAVARHLLRAGWQVRAMTRKPDQPPAQALADLGAEVVYGDMDRPETLPPLLAGAYGVFGVQNFWEVGYEREVAEGKALADAAAAAGVQHFVYSSVGSANRETGLPHFESKWLIEQYLATLGLPYTIFRPVFFMDNLLGSREGILAGRWDFGLPPEVPLQMVALDDIGGFVALAFDRREEWLGRATDLAGDELTGPQACAKLSATLGREVAYNPIPIPEIAKQNAEWAQMLQWFVDYGYEADISALRALYPPLHDFDAWLPTVPWE